MGDALHKTKLEMNKKVEEQGQESVKWRTLLFSLLAYFGLSLILGSVIGFILAFSGHSVEEVEQFFVGYNSLFLDAFAFFIVILLFKNIRLLLKGAFSIQPLKQGKTYLIMIASIIAIAIVQFALSYVENYQGQDELLGITGLNNDLTTILLFSLSIAVVTPLKEELLYRGVLFEFFSRKINVVTGVIVSSLVFGLLHIGYPITATIMGLIFLFVYRKTGSIWPAIIVHIIWNFIAVASIFTSLS